MKVKEIEDLYDRSSAGHIRRFIEQEKPNEIISVNEKIVDVMNGIFPWKKLVITIIYK